MGNVESRHQHASVRVIKRYSNRKLYDTKTSSYVTLMGIAEMVRAGEQVQVVDNTTKEDKTDVTLALIISEELKANPREIPVAALRALVKSRGEQLLHQLEEGPLRRLLRGSHEQAPPLRPGESQIDEESMGTEGGSGRSFRATLEEWHHILDERIRTVLPHWTGFREQERRLEELSRRVEQLERRLGAGPAAEDPGGGNGGQRE